MLSHNDVLVIELEQVRLELEQAKKRIAELELEVQPKYTHDCNACKFLGHFVGYDVYTCPNNSSLIARFSSYEPNYISMNRDDFRTMIANNTPIGFPEGKTVPIQTLIFSENCPAKYYQAILLALALC